MRPRRASRISDSAVGGGIGKQRNGSRRHGRQQRAGQQRLGRRFQHARGVDQLPALPTEILGQMNRVKAVGDQSFPPVGELARGQRLEVVARRGDGRVPGGELPDGVAEICCSGVSPRVMIGGPEVSNVGFGRTDCYPSVLQDEPSRLVADYGAGQHM